MLSPLSHLSIHSFSCAGVKPVRTGSHGPRAPIPPSSAFWMRMIVDFGVDTNGACFIMVTVYGYEGLYLQRTISRLTLANGSLGFHPRYGRSAGFASA